MRLTSRQGELIPLIVIAAAAVLLGGTGVLSPLLRRSRPVLATAFTVALLADGVFLGAAWWTAGGPGNNIEVLVTAYVLGTTLLASFRTGVKVALVAVG